MSITFPDGYTIPVAGPMTLASPDGYALKDPGARRATAAFTLAGGGAGLGALIGHFASNAQSTTITNTLPPNCGVPTPGCMNPTSQSLYAQFLYRRRFARRDGLATSVESAARRGRRRSPTLGAAPCSGAAHRSAPTFQARAAGQRSRHLLHARHSRHAGHGHPGHTRHRRLSRNSVHPYSRHPGNSADGALLPLGERRSVCSPAKSFPRSLRRVTLIPQMPTLIQQATRIQSAGNKPKLIDEYIGRVNTQTSSASVAHMRSPARMARARPDSRLR